MRYFLTTQWFVVTRANVPGITLGPGGPLYLHRLIDVPMVGEIRLVYDQF